MFPSVPVRALEEVSVAVIDWTPALISVAEKVCVPASAAVKV